MKFEHAKKLLELSENGYTIHYSSGYVDGSCTINMIADNEIVLSSSVFTDLKLSGLGAIDFTVSEEIEDWQNKEIN